MAKNPAAPRRRRKLRELSGRDLALVLIPAILLTGIAFWVAYKFVKPAPPDHIVIATGAEGGAYYTFGERYRRILARDGVTLELRVSQGSLENIALLMDPATGVETAFAQGGSGSGVNSPGIYSLGSIYYEPVWIFSRRKLNAREIADFRGRRVAVGPDGSGNRALALQLIALNGVGLPPTRLLYLDSKEATTGLRNGSVDAAIIVAAPESPAVQELLAAPEIALLSIDNADAYIVRFPYLAKLTLPRGVVSFVNNIPSRNITLLAPTANILAREDVHPALVHLILSAMKEVHSGTNWFQHKEQFPAPLDVDFPLSPQAERFYKSGAPFLYRYLPFWLANLVERLWVLLVPLIAIMVPLVKLVPPLYGWRVRSRIYRWYGELKFLEQEVDANPQPSEIPDMLQRLDKLDQAVTRLSVPLAYANQLYTLKEHIQLVRREITELRLASESHSRQEDTATIQTHPASGKRA